MDNEIKNYCKSCKFYSNLGCQSTLICHEGNRFIAVDVQPVKRGKWEDMQYDETLEYWTAICSNCGSISSDSFPIIGSHLFCERCGADMREHEPIKG